MCCLGQILIVYFVHFHLHSINRPGGHGKITCVHCNEYGNTDSLDVKYTITGGFDKQVDPDLVKPHAELDRGRRNRRTRQVFVPPTTTTTTATDTNNDKENIKKKKKTKEVASKKTITKDKPVTAVKKSKKRKKAVTNDESQVVIIPEAQDSIPKYIHILTAAAGTTGKSVPFASPLSHELGVESKPARQYMLASADADAPQVPTCDDMSNCSFASVDDDDEQPEASVEVSRTNSSNSPVSRALSLGCGDFVPLKKKSSSGKEKKKQNKPSAPRIPRVKVTLREVYDQEWQKANDFVKNVVTDNKEAEPPANEAEELPQVDPRQSAFLAVFNDLLQNNDGTVEEKGLIGKVNASVRSSKKLEPFTKADVDQILVQLCEQNKIMRCDGQVYSI